MGTVTADKVLSGYTFTSATGVGITGTMVNRGTLNWNPTSGTTQTVQPGYYSGGTLNSSDAYNAGVTTGKNTTDPNSPNYQAGYNAGITFADGRVNPDSESYKEGETAGIESLSTLTISGTVYINYGGFQHVNLTFTKNSDGQWIETSAKNPNPIVAITLKQ